MRALEETPDPSRWFVLNGDWFAYRSALNRASGIASTWYCWSLKICVRQARVHTSYVVDREKMFLQSCNRPLRNSIPLRIWRPAQYTQSHQKQSPSHEERSLSGKRCYGKRPLPGFERMQECSGTKMAKHCHARSCTQLERS